MCPFSSAQSWEQNCSWTGWKEQEAGLREFCSWTPRSLSAQCSYDWVADTHMHVWLTQCTWKWVQGCSRTNPQCIMPVTYTTYMRNRYKASFSVSLSGGWWVQGQTDPYLASAQLQLGSAISRPGPPTHPQSLQQHIPPRTSKFLELLNWWNWIDWWYWIDVCFLTYLHLFWGSIGHPLFTVTSLPSAPLSLRPTSSLTAATTTFASPTSSSLPLCKADPDPSSSQRGKHLD